MLETHQQERSCMGERYIGCGNSTDTLILRGTPGNALGAYLDGGNIELFGNAQDATGDTMNAGSITIHGNTGDAAGYAMRGGAIYVEGNAGYRAGIHMKAYKDKLPVLVVGGACGSFLGEYQAGGLIVVLGLDGDGEPPVGYFCGTGMHGGRIFLRCNKPPHDLPEQVIAAEATDEDIALIMPYLETYCEKFSRSIDDILPHTFYVLSPNTKNPYQQMYVHN